MANPALVPLLPPALVRLYPGLATYQPLIIESCAVSGLGQVLVNSNQEVVQANGPILQVIGARRRSVSPARCIYDLSVAAGRYCVGGDGTVRDAPAAQPPEAGATLSGATLPGALLPGGIIPGAVAGNPSPFAAGTRAVVPGSTAAGPIVPGSTNAIVPPLPALTDPGILTGGAPPSPAPRALGQCTPVLLVH